MEDKQEEDEEDIAKTNLTQSLQNKIIKKLSEKVTEEWLWWLNRKLIKQKLI